MYICVIMPRLTRMWTDLLEHDQIAGRNQLVNVREVAHLRRQMALRSLTVLGNPMCDATSSRTFVIAQLRRLQFLDNQRLTPAHITKAIELHQARLPPALYAFC